MASLGKEINTFFRESFERVLLITLLTVSSFVSGSLYLLFFYIDQEYLFIGELAISVSFISITGFLLLGLSYVNAISWYGFKNVFYSATPLFRFLYASLLWIGFVYFVGGIADVLNVLPSGSSFLSITNIFISIYSLTVFANLVLIQSLLWNRADTREVDITNVLESSRKDTSSEESHVEDGSKSED